MRRDLLELCEDFVLHMPPRLDLAVVDTPRFVYVPRAPGGSLVQRIRLAEEEVEDAVEEVRALAREHGRDRVVWWVGELTTPGDLEERLRALGLEPDEDDPWLASLAITEEPVADGPADVAAVDDVDDFLAAQEIDLLAAGVPDDERERLMERNRDYWRQFRSEQVLRLYLARLDGHAVGYARARVGEHADALLGGGVLEHARGRGVYRSLVHARWRDAAARGATALFTQANHMSRPILERLGFERLGEIRQLVDRVQL